MSPEPSPTYAPGDWAALAVDGCWLLADAAPDAPAVTAFASRIAEGLEQADLLEAIVTTGLARTPSFALVLTGGPGVALARGSAHVAITDGADDMWTVDAEGAATWVEARLPEGAVSVLLAASVEDAQREEDADLALPAEAPAAASLLLLRFAGPAPEGPAEPDTGIEPAELDTGGVPALGALPPPTGVTPFAPASPPPGATPFASAPEVEVEVEAERSDAAGPAEPTDQPTADAGELAAWAAGDEDSLPDPPPPAEPPVSPLPPAGPPTAGLQPAETGEAGPAGDTGAVGAVGENPDPRGPVVREASGPTLADVVSPPRPSLPPRPAAPPTLPGPAAADAEPALPGRPASPPPAVPPRPPATARETSLLSAVPDEPSPTDVLRSGARRDKPLPVAPTVRPDPAELIPTRTCPSGHGNPADAVACRRCGEPVSGPESAQPRPPLGVLHLSDGGTVPVDRGVLVGRTPSWPGAPELRPHLVQLTSSLGEISRSHVEVTLDGWDVVAIDLGSTNGTSVVGADGAERWLATGVPSPLADGDVIVVATGVSLRYDALG